MTLSTFAKNLRHLRKQKNYSQDQFAKRIFTSRSVVAKIETGKVSPTLCTVERICKVFDTDISTITNNDLSENSAA